MAHGITTLAVQDILLVRTSTGDTTTEIHGLDVVASITIVVSQVIYTAICASCLHIDLIREHIIVTYRRTFSADEAEILKITPRYASKLIICQDGLSFCNFLKTIVLYDKSVQLDKHVNYVVHY